MTTKEIIDMIDSGVPIKGGSPIHDTMHRLSQEAIRITDYFIG